MIICDPIDRRRIAGFSWNDPITGLQRLFPHRPFSIKKDREEHQAALFAYGLQQQAAIFGWQYAMEPEERSDRDCLLRCLRPEMYAVEDRSASSKKRNDSPYIYKPVQLKELPPASLNSRIELQSLITAFGKYAAQPSEEMLVIAVYVSRATTINLASLDVTGLRIQQLWLYGHLSNGRCFMVGDRMKAMGARYDYDFPL